MKVSELIGAELDYWVAKAEGFQCAKSHSPELQKVLIMALNANGEAWFPSERWGHGGPIIERERISLRCDDYEDIWQATRRPKPDNPEWPSAHLATGPTPLIAAMRAYVASKFGDEVPSETLKLEVK